MRIVILIDPEFDINCIIKKKGPWAGWFDHYLYAALRRLGHEVVFEHFGPDIRQSIERLDAASPDLVFNLSQHMFHDRGYSFFAPAMLEALGYSYTGNHSRGMLFSIDKGLCKTILRQAGVLVPNYAVYPNDSIKTMRSLAFPLLIKVARSGGSTALTRRSLVRRPGDLLSALRTQYREWDQPLTCEEFVAGREFSVGVVERGGVPECLPPAEWYFPPGLDVLRTFVSSKLKWDKKYQKKLGVRYQRARLPESLMERIDSVSKKAFRALEFRDYASFDFRLATDGSLYLVDANANPGIWPGSGRWKSVPFGSLVQEIIQNALARARRK
jgi:D-alanine-D-alanine ligase